MFFLNDSLICAKEKDTVLDTTLIDISRLSITHVSASSVNGNRQLNDEFYGVLNLFDNGNNYIKGINYSYWFSDAESQHWVKLSFDKPVMINSVVVETTGNRRPKEYSLDFAQISGESRNTIKYFESIPIKGLRTINELKSPIINVSEIQINFPGPEAVEISEIRVLGKVLDGIDQTSQPPALAGPSITCRAAVRA